MVFLGVIYKPKKLIGDNFTSVDSFGNLPRDPIEMNFTNISPNSEYQSAQSTPVANLAMSQQPRNPSVTSGSLQNQRLNLANLSYGELLQIAERQKRAIEANNSLMAQKESRLKHLRQQMQVHAQNEKTTLTDRLKKLNFCVQNEEAQLQRLRKQKMDFDEEIKNHKKLQSDFQESKLLCQEKQEKLEKCREKIEKINEKLAKIREKRLINAKKLELRRVDEHLSQLKTKFNENFEEKQQIIKENEKINKEKQEINKENRPKAAVEPFKIMGDTCLNPDGAVSSAFYLKTNASNAYLTSKGFQTAFLAMEETLQQQQGGENKRFCWSQSRDPGSLDDVPPPDLIPASEKGKYPIGSIQQEVGNVSKGMSNLNLNLNLMPQVLDPDSIAIRNDTIRAAKRRSWAEHHPLSNTHSAIDETEHIRALLRREQQKGKSTVNLSWIFGQLSNSGSTMTPNFPFDEPPGEDLSSLDENGPPPEVFLTPEMRQLNEDENADNENDHQKLHSINISVTNLDQDREEKDDDNSISSRSESTITIVEVKPPEIITEDDENVQLLDDKCRNLLKLEPSKGILRPLDKPPHGQHIRFDPLALLLDAALEGELEMVKKCAAQLNTVNQSNGEGITALHNAICAGHYEIVRFLVEADADVNAQDSDGWTPLHCAASCNNLPTVKFLVERGACVFATTTNDHQTPVDKCEEEADGFDGCSQYLLSVQEKMGSTLNGGRVYAAFDYEAQFDDELDLKTGDELVISDKNGPEKGWWIAKNSSTNAEGIVPRNYLSLYPRLCFQRASNSAISSQSESAGTLPMTSSEQN